MPIYEYRCTSCGETFEILQKMGAAPLGECRACDGPLEKLVSRTSFQLKGGGWFAGGYGSGSAPKGDAAGEGAKESKGSNGEKTGEGAKAVAKGPCGSGCGCH